MYIYMYIFDGRVYKEDVFYNSIKIKLFFNEIENIFVNLLL
jgi:hypothetical protein